MEAYTWTRGTFTEGPDDAPSYCAMGALLRHAGVPRARIAEAPLLSLLREYVPILRARYGISDTDVVHHIMVANDRSASQAEATWRVLGLVSRIVEPEGAPSWAVTTYAEPDLPPAA
jgi:hypothetical protein